MTEALVRLACAYADMKTTEADTKFDETLKRLKAWVDIDTGDKYAALVIERETRASRYGNVLKLMGKLLSKEIKEDVIKPMTRAEILEKRSEIFEKLGYSILVEYDKGRSIIASPPSYMLF